MKFIVLVVAISVLSLMIIAGCGGSSSDTPSDDNSNQGISFNKYSKGSSSKKTGGSIISTKPSNQKTNQSNETSNYQNDKQAEVTSTDKNESDNQDNIQSESKENAGLPINQSGTENQQATKQNIKSDENDQATDSSSMPCRFWGIITINNSSAPPKTKVEAYVNDIKVGTYETIGHGYVVNVSGSYPNEQILFYVNNIEAGKGTWEKGGNIELNLSVP